MSARRAVQLAEITRELRADGWWPREAYLCGCVPTALCSDHDRLRARFPEDRTSAAKKTCTHRLRDALRAHHPIMRSETGPFSGCRCGQVELGQDVVAHVVAELRRALDGDA